MSTKAIVGRYLPRLISKMRRKIPLVSQDVMPRQYSPELEEPPSSTEDEELSEDENQTSTHNGSNTGPSLAHKGDTRLKPDWNCSGPPFMAPHKFPPEIILHIAVFLDDASLMALHHTNRDLFYSVSLTADQFLRAQKAHYLAESVKLANRDNKNLQGYCWRCHRLRPLTSFSISEVMALERLEYASCLLHAQLWICPHQSYDYEKRMEVLGNRMASDFSRLGSIPHRADCEVTGCNFVFHHKYVYTKEWPGLDYHIKSEIAMFRVVHQGGPGTIRDTIQHHLTKDRLQTVINMIHAPVCDHYLLSDEQVRKNFDPADLDLDDQAWHSACVPRERARTNRSSDDSCSYCQVLGVQTGFRFLARAYKQTFSGTVMIGLYAVVLRSFGQEGRIGREQPDEHWRCHGASERRLARFRNTWTPTPGNAPYVYPNDEWEHL
jgi:hypothetical protein